MPTLCIAVHDEMLAAALAVPKIRRPLNPEEVLQTRALRYQRGNAPYPAWYLFGCRRKGVAGLVDGYARQASVFLLPESLLTADVTADYLDVQFCTLSRSLLSKFKSRGIKIFGYLPEEFASKAFLAAALADNGGKHFLPLQRTYGKDSSPDLPPGEQSVWIVKSPYGAAGNNSDGSPYTVWQKAVLEENLPSLLAALNKEDKLICSEFVITADPYAHHADHVVHKMPFVADGQAAVPYGRCCQRFIYRCNWQALAERGSLPLGEFIGTPEITTGDISRIDAFPDFVEKLSFQRGRLMLSVDFIIPPDGRPRYLETNKLAATFAEQFDPLLPPLIDYYARLPLNN